MVRETGDAWVFAVTRAGADSNRVYRLKWKNLALLGRTGGAKH
jgi:hypothetical protein